MYDPAEIFAISSAVRPLLHEKTKGLTPPFTLKSIDPLEFPKQATLLTEEDSCNALGSVKVVEKGAAHPLASVIVTEYVPAASPVKSSVVAALFQT